MKFRHMLGKQRVIHVSGFTKTVLSIFWKHRKEFISVQRILYRSSSPTNEPHQHMDGKITRWKRRRGKLLCFRINQCIWIRVCHLQCMYFHRTTHDSIKISGEAPKKDHLLSCNDGLIFFDHHRYFFLVMVEMVWPVAKGMKVLNLNC